MQSQAFKHRSPAGKKHLHTQPDDDPPVNSDSDGIADTLIETNVGILVTLGRCLKRFGPKPLVGFVVGVACMYGYAVYKPLPYVKGKTETTDQAPVAPVEIKTVQLHGRIRGADDKPVKGLFAVGVLMNQFGPSQTVDGSFVLKVPQSETYNFAYWTTDDEKVRVSYGNIAEKDGNGYRLQNPLVLTTDLTASVTSSRSRPSRSRTQVARLVSGGH